MDNALLYAVAYLWLGVATAGFCSWAHRKTEGRGYSFAPWVATFAAWPLAWVIVAGMIWIQFKEARKNERTKKN
jgi:hypothetical protein